MTCLFILLKISFIDQKFLLLMMSDLAIFSFIDDIFGDFFMNDSLNPRSQGFYPVSFLLEVLEL